MSLISSTEEYLTSVVKNLGYEVEIVKLEKSKMQEFGQYQINIAMTLTKQKGENPRAIAEKIVSALDSRFININIQGPGFINLTFADDVLKEYTNECLNDFNKYLDKPKQSRKIILDYGGANVAKTLHVGHLRCNIGESIRRLLNLFGDETISDVHWGDWGTPLGLVIREIQERYPDLPYFDKNFTGIYPEESPVTNDELGEIYPAASLRKKEDEVYAKEAKDLTERLQKREKGIYDLWKKIVNVSEEDCKKVYDFLNCHFDLSYGESDADLYVDKVIDFLTEKGVTEISNGALIMNIKNENDNKEMPPLMLKKSDGAVLYDTTELATIYQRMEDYHPDEIWYFTDERQSLHFEQTFRGAYMSGLVPESCNLKFFGFGTINGKDGKPFKTRDGGVMSLDMLIEQVKEKLLTKLDKYTEEEKKNIADVLTVATIKYADLLPYRTTDFIFDIDKITSFEGKTGPYVLYTMVRIKSILDKVNIDNASIKSIYSDTERNIYIKLLELAKTLTKAYNEKTLSYICEYLFDLCSLFNKFYGECNIVNEQDMDKKESYVALLNLLYNTGTMLLNILAIEVPDKM